MPDNEKRRKTIRDKQEKEKALFLEQLRKGFNVLVASQKAGIGRATYYRWLGGDADFRVAADQARREGKETMDDYVESKNMTKINEGDGASIRFYLKSRHPNYKPEHPWTKGENTPGLTISEKKYWSIIRREAGRMKKEDPEGFRKEFAGLFKEENKS